MVLPFLVTGLLAIPIYLYERFFPLNSKRIQEKIVRFNFPEIRIPHFEELSTDK